MRKLGEKLEIEFEDPIPKSAADAAVREVISLIPVLGDAFLLYEALKAFDAGKEMTGVIYLVNALPGPTLPFTHFITYGLREKR